MGPKVWERVMMGRDEKGKVQEKERGGRDKKGDSSPQHLVKDCKTMNIN